MQTNGKWGIDRRLHVNPTQDIIMSVSCLISFQGGREMGDSSHCSGLPLRQGYSAIFSLMPLLPELSQIVEEHRLEAVLSLSRWEWVHVAFLSCPFWETRVQSGTARHCQFPVGCVMTLPSLDSLVAVHICISCWIWAVTMCRTLRINYP